MFIKAITAPGAAPPADACKPIDLARRMVFLR